VLATDMSPSQYIVKVDRATGEPLSDPVEPADLLVHAHRDHHPVEIAAQFLASRLVQVTGNESLVKGGLKLAEAVGSRVATGVTRSARERNGSGARSGSHRKTRAPEPSATRPAAVVPKSTRVPLRSVTSQPEGSFRYRAKPPSIRAR